MVESRLEFLEIDVNAVDGLSGTVSFGALISETDGVKSVEIFEISENQGPHTQRAFFDLAPKVRDRLFPNTPLAQIQWTLTNTNHRSPVTLSEVDGKIAKIDFLSGYNSSPSFMNFEGLKKSYDAPEGFRIHYNNRFGGNVGGSNPISVVAVPAPNHPRGILYMRNDHPDMSDIVLVDTQRFMRDWQDSDRNRLGEGNQYIFTSDIDTAVKHTRVRQNGDFRSATSIADANFNTDSTDTPISIQGRHRTANLATLGAPYIPLAVPKDDPHSSDFAEKYAVGQTPEAIEAHTKATVETTSEMHASGDVASKGVGLAGVGVDLANGDYVSAGVGAAMEAADTEAGHKAAGKVASGFLEKLGTGFKFFGKRVPVVGAVVTAGFVAHETGKHAVEGEWDKAGAAFVAGAAETVGNFVGFGVGDAAREGVRQGIIQVAGDDYSEIDKSGIREVGEGAYELVSDWFTDDEPSRDVVSDGGIEVAGLNGETLSHSFTGKSKAPAPIEGPSREPVAQAEDTPTPSNSPTRTA